MIGRLVQIQDAAVDDDLELGTRLLQAVDPVVVKRWQFAVLFRAKALQPGLAGVQDKAPAAGIGQPIDEVQQVLKTVVVVDAQAQLGGDRQAGRRLHGCNTPGHQGRLAHQASAKAAPLHPVGRAAQVEVDLVVAPGLGDRRAAGEIRRLRAAELQGKRVFDGAETDEPSPVAMQDGAAGDHFSVKQGTARKATQEDPLVPVGPIHHGGHCENFFFIFQGFMIHFKGIKVRTTWLNLDQFVRICTSFDL